MTIHHHIEGLAGLVLAVQDLVNEVRIMNTRATCPVEVIDGKDPAVQNALGIKPKSSRWTSFEENILIHGYSMNWTPKPALYGIYKKHFSGVKSFLTYYLFGRNGQCADL